MKNTLVSTRENTNDLTGMLWPSKVCSSFPLATSKIVVVPSIVLHARVFPSRLHATPKTNFPKPVLSTGFPSTLVSVLGTVRVYSNFQVAVFHIFTEQLPPPATASRSPYTSSSRKVFRISEPNNVGNLMYKPFYESIIKYHLQKIYNTT
jgi:hypothetical protein